MSTPAAKKRLKTSCDHLQLIRYAALKNREDMQQFYSKNKSKLPPILQSRHIFIKHLRENTNEKLNELTKKAIEFLSQRKNVSSVEERETVINSSTQIIPRVGRLIFDRDNPRKIKRQYLISYNSTQRNKTEPTYKNNQSNTSVLNKIESIVKLKNIEQKTKQQQKEEKKDKGGNKGLKKNSCEKISLNNILLKLIDKEESSNNKKGRKKSITMMKGMDQIQPWGNTLHQSQHSTWIRFYK